MNSFAGVLLYNSCLAEHDIYAFKKSHAHENMLLPMILFINVYKYKVPTPRIYI